MNVYGRVGWWGVCALPALPAGAPLSRHLVARRTARSGADMRLPREGAC
ncbi:hypothetical protein [Streptomyces roseus]|nr:hypothetical protein [Streptomyces roseus]